jgi:DNA polymerase-3 subunit alpha
MDGLPIERLDSLKGIIERHRGTVPAYISFEMTPRGKATMQLPADMSVTPNDDLRLEVEQLFGYNAATFE